MQILDDVFMFRSGPYKSWTVNSTTGQDHTNPGRLIQLLVRTIQILDGYSTTGQDHTNPELLIQLLVRTIQILDG